MNRSRSGFTMFELMVYVIVLSMLVGSFGSLATYGSQLTGRSTHTAHALTRSEHLYVTIGEDLLQAESVRVDPVAHTLVVEAADGTQITFAHTPDGLLVDRPDGREHIDEIRDFRCTLDERGYLEASWHIQPTEDRTIPFTVGWSVDRGVLP